MAVEYFVYLSLNTVMNTEAFFYPSKLLDRKSCFLLISCFVELQIQEQAGEFKGTTHIYQIT
jgi:hypothetical protein